MLKYFQVIEKKHVKSLPTCIFCEISIRFTFPNSCYGQEFIYVPTVIREFRNCDKCHTILEKKICDMIINMQSRKPGSWVKKVNLYHCCHAMFKVSTTGLATYFSTENSVDGVKKAGLSRADLSKKKDVCSGNVCLRHRFVGKQVLFDFI